MLLGSLRPSSQTGGVGGKLAGMKSWGLVLMEKGVRPAMCEDSEPTVNPVAAGVCRVQWDQLLWTFITLIDL